MFQEEVEKGRQEAEKELRRRVREGRAIAEKNFTRLLEEGKIEAERQYQQTIQEEREKGEKIFQACPLTLYLNMNSNRYLYFDVRTELMRSEPRQRCCSKKRLPRGGLLLRRSSMRG